MPYKKKSRSIKKSNSKKRVSKKRVSKKAKGRQVSKRINNMRPGRSKNNNIDSSLMVLERQF